jgi:predicted regulator of Ras-like GTPase activity (Roadblock/LC7/MglB family)
MSGKNTNEALDGLLRGFVERVADVLAVVVSSTDGIRKHAYGLESNGDADKASAVSSGMFSLTNGADRAFVGGAGYTRQIIAEVDGGLIFITRPAEGTLLTVLASHDTDLGLIGYEMKMLGQSIGPHLATAPRVISATG